METTTFQALKLSIIAASQLSRDALHIYVGLATFVVAALVFRRSIRSWLPLLAVLVVAMVIEAVDLRDDLLTRGRPRWLASTHDLLNTMVWPTVLFLVARTRRWARANEPAAKPRDEA
jgi:cell shape-determining protein MreD